MQKSKLNNNYWHIYFHHYHLHHYVPGLLQRLAIMAFQSSLSSVLLMSSLFGYSFLVTKLLRLSVYFASGFSLLLVSQTSQHNICISSPSALFICPKNCSCLFLMVLSGDLLYTIISISFLFDFFQPMTFSLFF